MGNLVYDFLQLVYPRNCTACSKALQKEEHVLCTTCFADLPWFSLGEMERNPAYLVLSSLYDLSIFYAMLRYADQNVSQRMIQSLKYKDDPQVGFLLGQLLGRRCKNKIAKDAVLLAIPLHSTKEKIRGYNQSEEIVKGMQYECLSWQITTTVRRKVNTVTQTKKSRAERWENVADIFEIQDMSELQAKHVVIVDDVITTGSTILSMIKCIMLANPKSIGVVTAASPSKI